MEPIRRDFIYVLNIFVFLLYALSFKSRDVSRSAAAVYLWEHCRVCVCVRVVPLAEASIHALFAACRMLLLLLNNTRERE
jgi:hypothetical protein